MKFGKTIKRIVAIGMGASMLGATLLGASAAASLNQWPAPFVKDGKFSGYIVVGDKAWAEDTLGAIDIGMALQYAASVKAGSASSSETASAEGDAYRVAAAGNALNLYQTVASVVSVLDSGDLKTGLADNAFKAKTSADYTQTLTMPTGTANVQFTTDPDADVEDPALFLVLNSTDSAIDYKLSFKTQAESDWVTTSMDDFEDQKLSILGKEYTLTQAINSSNEAKLTLMSGAVQDTLEVGQTKKYDINGIPYEVTVKIVSGDTSAAAVAKLLINGETTKSLATGETYTLKNGVDIGIKEILPTKSGDVVQNLVEFYLGADKIVLNGATGTIDIGEERISDATVTITNDFTGSTAKLSEIQIVLAPTDTYYVPVGGKLSDVLDNSDYKLFLSKFGVDYQFAGLEVSPSETLKFVASGKNNYKIEFTNKKGVSYSQKVFYYDTAAGTTSITDVAGLGDDSSDPLRTTEGQQVCKNDFFITEFNKNTRIMKLLDISGTDSVVSLKDVGTGDTIDNSYTSANMSNIVLDGTTYVLSAVNSTSDCFRLNDTATDAGDSIADIWTKYETKVVIRGGNNTVVNGSYATTGYQVAIYEDPDAKEESSASPTIGNFTLAFAYTAAEGLDLNTINDNEPNFAMTALDSSDTSSAGMSPWGTSFKQTNTDAQDKWEITIPQKEAVAQVFVTATGGSVVAKSAASGDAVILNKIDATATKLASEVGDMATASNLILVGGPCANSAVGKASAAFPTCDGWTYGAGEAIVQLVEQTNGNVDFLVSGTNAADTRAAAKIVAAGTALKTATSNTQKVTVATGALTAVVAAPVAPVVPVEPATV